MSESLPNQFKFIDVDVRERVLEITLARPDVYNALHGPAHQELAKVFDFFERAQDLWVAIITGAGDKSFCAGNDLKVTDQGGDIGPPKSGFAGLANRFDREKPLIAAVNGFAMGGGMEIVLACDLALAAPTAKFALPEVKVGLFAGAGGVQRLIAQIGEKRAMELILTGRTIDAQEAEVLGIVNKVVQEGSVIDAARQLAEEIVEVSPSSVRASKKAINRMNNLSRLDEAIEFSKPLFLELLETDDSKEGVAAFAAKRRPKWTNS